MQPISEVKQVFSRDNEKTEMSKLQFEGRELMVSFFVCMKTCVLYDLDNENAIKHLDAFRTSIRQAFESEDEISLAFIEGYLFYNQQRLKVGLDLYQISKFIQQQFERLNISGLALRKGVELDELKNMISLLTTDHTEETSADKLNRVLIEQSVQNIVFLQPQMMISSHEAGAVKDEKLRARQTFFKAVNVVQEILTTTSKGQQVNMKRVKRVVHSLVDEIIKNEEYTLRLAALKSFDRYTFNHCVNVSIFSISLGLRMGFSRAELAELGISAIFHDFGKTSLPLELLNKADGLSHDDFSRIQEHPIHGAKALARSFSLDRYTARSIIVAFEHHKNLDGTGYPDIGRVKPVNLYSRIVTLCDFFDALTSDRIYRKHNVPIDEVVLKMIQQANTKFDPHLLKMLINIVGIYPAGSLLLLDTQELGLVISNNPDDIFRPTVKIIADKDGKKNPSPVVHLATYDESAGRYIRNVIHMVEPDKYGIDISEYILSD